MQYKHHFLCLALGICLLLPAFGCSADDDARLGEAVRTSFFTVQADEVLSGENGPAAPELPPAPESCERVWVKLSVTAHTDLFLYYDDFDLEADGIPLFPERVANALQLPEQQPLCDGQAADGYLVYSVPAGAKKLRLVYTEYYEGDRQGDTYAVRLK